VAEVLGALGTDGRPSLDALLGEGLQSIGDWEGALETFRRVQRSLDGQLGAIAWRLGALLYVRGDSAACIEVLSGAQTTLSMRMLASRDPMSARASRSDSPRSSRA
jgi:hypothetical protein